MFEYEGWIDDFESGVAGWSALGGATLLWNADQAYEGTRSMRVLVNVAGAGDVFVSKTFTLEGKGAHGRTIAYTAFVRPNSVANLASIDDNSSLVAGQWQLVSGTVVGDPVTGMADLFFTITLSGPYNDFIWFDLVKLEFQHFEVLAPQPTPIPFPYWPDGSVEVEESWSFITDVLPSYNAQEKRSGKRQYPRLSLSFQALEVDPVPFQRLRTALIGNTGARWSLPWWPSVQKSTVVAGAPAIGEVHTLPHSDHMFRVGGTAFVWKDETTYDLLAVTAVAGNQVTVFGTGTFTHVQGEVFLIPAVICVNNQSADLSAAIIPAGMTRIVMTGEPDNYPIFNDVWSAPLYRGVPLLDYPYNNGDMMITTMDRPVLTVDNGNSIYISTPTDSALRKYRIEIMNESRDQLDLMRALFMTVEGREGAFWVVDRSEAMTMVAQALSGSSLIIVKDAEFRTHLFPHDAKRHVAVAYRNGTIHVAKVTAAVLSGGNEQLTLDTPLPDDAPAGSVVCLVTYCRMDSDTFIVQHMTDELSASSIDVVELPVEG